MELKGSKTEKNLMTAFAGESQACVKYQYYASQAKKDGYVKIQNIFTETSNNEKEHAKLWFKALHGGKVPTTTENLKMRLQVKTMSGQICTQQWLKKLVKKALMILLPCSKA